MTQLTGQTDPAILAGGKLSRVFPPGRGRDYMQLTRVRLAGWVVITAYIGFIVAAAYHPWNWLELAGAMIGTGLSCLGASVFNQIYERDTDALMARTRNRPLCTARLGVGEAMALGVGLSIAGVAILWITTNWLAAVISLGTIISYAVIYTPLKRVTSWSTAVGAIPGAAPPLIGYAAVTGRVGIEALLVFAIMFVWQLPHFFSAAWLRREEYAGAGLKMLPVVDHSGLRTFRQILITCFALIPLGVLPTFFRVTGLTYFVIALLAGIIFLALGLVFMKSPTRRHARTLFFASLIYLPLILIVLALDLV